MLAELGFEVTTAFIIVPVTTDCTAGAFELLSNVGKKINVTYYFSHVGDKRLFNVINTTQ